MVFTSVSKHLNYDKRSTILLIFILDKFTEGVLNYFYVLQRIKMMHPQLKEIIIYISLIKYLISKS